MTYHGDLDYELGDYDDCGWCGCCDECLDAWLDARGDPRGLLARLLDWLSWKLYRLRHLLPKRCPDCGERDCDKPGCIPF